MNTESENRPATQPLPLAYPDSLTLYHASSKGNGAAIRLEPRINRPGEQGYNCFFLEAASQKPSAPGAAERHATFDWEHKITVKLGFSDICEFLAVLEGLQSHAGGRRNGLFHESRDAVTIIRFEIREEGGFYLGLSRKSKASEEPLRISFVLSPVESVGIRCLLSHGLFAVTFPTVGGVAMRGRRETAGNDRPSGLKLAVGASV